MRLYPKTLNNQRKEVDIFYKKLIERKYQSQGQQKSYRWKTRHKVPAQPNSRAVIQ